MRSHSIFLFRKSKICILKTQLSVYASTIFQKLQYLIKHLMPLKNSYSLQKRKYAQISVKVSQPLIQKRAILVQLVLQQGKTLAQASRKLNIKPSTAKLIVKKYQQTGKFFMKKLKNAVKNRPNVEAQPQPEKISIKMEEDDLSSQKHQDQIPKVPAQQNGVAWYGYNFYPWNYQYTYYKP